MLLNEALRLMRIYHDMKQSDLASALDVTKSYVSELEAGNRTPSLQVLESYARTFDVPLSSILFFAENVENPDGVSKTRKYVASKIIKILGAIADKSDEDVNG
jgi:transcriptional regulator with XRE-family HTH domain